MWTDSGALQHQNSKHGGSYSALHAICAGGGRISSSIRSFAPITPPLWPSLCCRYVILYMWWCLYCCIYLAFSVMSYCIMCRCLIFSYINFLLFCFCFCFLRNLCFDVCECLLFEFFYAPLIWLYKKKLNKMLHINFFFSWFFYLFCFHLQIPITKLELKNYLHPNIHRNTFKL